MYMRGSAVQYVFHSDFQPGRSQTETCWENLNQKIIDKSIDHWRDKLKAVIRLNGGHIEQLF